MLQLLFQITQLLSLLLNHLMIALGRLLELLDLRLQPILLVRHHGELALRPLQVHLQVLNLFAKVFPFSARVLKLELHLIELLLEIGIVVAGSCVVLVTATTSSFLLECPVVCKSAIFRIDCLL